MDVELAIKEAALVTCVEQRLKGRWEMGKFDRNYR